MVLGVEVYSIIDIIIQLVVRYLIAFLIACSYPVDIDPYICISHFWDLDACTDLKVPVV